MDRRLFLKLAAFGAASLACAGLPGCSSAPQKTDAEADAEIVRSAVDKDLSELKAADGDAFDRAIDKMNELFADKFTEMGITPEELATDYLRKFDYEIEDVRVNGSSATVRIKLSARSVVQIMRDTAAKGDPLHFKRQDLLDTLHDAEVQDNEATVYAKKGDDGSWDVTESLTAALVRLCL